MFKRILCIGFSVVLIGTAFAGGEKDATKPAAPQGAAAQPAAQQTAAQQPAAAPSAFKEAPMLADQVKAGSLPALASRLPKNPLVIKPEFEIGKFGGTINRGTLSPSSYLVISNHAEPLWDFPYPFKGSGPVVPNLAEKWEFSADGKVLTVTLREGVKWSDGQPFTADDILFVWEDIWLDEKIIGGGATFPGGLKVGGETPKLEKIDGRTIRFTFKIPFFYALQVFGNQPEWAWPKHFLSKYHPKYNPSATYEDFNANWVDWWKGRGKVTLQAWMLEEFATGQKISMVRNPYYFKVDTAGNQLPYADRHIYRIIEDRPTIALKLIAGELDNDGMWVGVPQLALFMTEKASRGFDIGWYEGVEAMGMFFNLDYEDPVLKAVFRNTSFRRAWSIAIDRAAIGKTFYYDQLEPTGTSFAKITNYWDADIAKSYSAYDPAASKKLLDDAGFKDKDGDGYRETPDGKKLEIVIDLAKHDLYVPLNEMVQEQLKAVGIKVVLNIQLQDFVIERRNSAKYQVHIWDVYGLHKPVELMNELIPTVPNTPFWHPKAGEAPLSPEYKQFADILRGSVALPYEEHLKQMKTANKLLAENVWFVYIGSFRRPYFIGAKMGNLPKTAHRVPADYPPFRPYQIYIK